MSLVNEPTISVGVISAEVITVNFLDSYTSIDGSTLFSGTHIFRIKNGHFFMDDNEIVDSKKLEFISTNINSRFELHEVVIGIGFHWQRAETQTFTGDLSIIVDDDKIWAVNRLKIEDYLFCVIASEMSATSSLELLKAHAVVSRSWLMAQLARHNDVAVHSISDDARGLFVRYYDRDDHHLFDVCADDHCQRYQGVTRANNPAVRAAIDATRGLLLTHNGQICDARFSKCCGGQTELFETCWQDEYKDYLTSFVDNELNNNDLDLTIEANAVRWIKSQPKAYCNTNNSKILRQILNSYDQETPDFYRWRVVYNRRELTDIFRKKSGFDIGEIVDLQPIERGPSGRIKLLKVVGTKRSLTIGKELEIRRVLSPSHLYSSAFIVERSDDGETFTFIGAGWGHGVGMCQIGAAVMAENGFEFLYILQHYFRNSQIEKLWN